MILVTNLVKLFFHFFSSLIEKIDELARERLGVSAPEELKTPGNNV